MTPLDLDNPPKFLDLKGGYFILFAYFGEVGEVEAVCVKVGLNHLISKSNMWEVTKQCLFRELKTRKYIVGDCKFTYQLE